MCFCVCVCVCACEWSRGWEWKSVDVSFPVCVFFCVFLRTACVPVQCPKLVFLTFADVCFRPVRLYQDLSGPFLVGCGCITLSAKPEQTLIDVRTINEETVQWLKHAVHRNVNLISVLMQLVYPQHIQPFMSQIFFLFLLFKKGHHGDHVLVS